MQQSEIFQRKAWAWLITQMGELFLLEEHGPETKVNLKLNLLKKATEPPLSENPCPLVDTKGTVWHK